MFINSKNIIMDPAAVTTKTRLCLWLADPDSLTLNLTNPPSKLSYSTTAATNICVLETATIKNDQNQLKLSHILIINRGVISVDWSTDWLTDWIVAAHIVHNIWSADT